MRSGLLAAQASCCLHALSGSTPAQRQIETPPTLARACIHSVLMCNHWAQGIELGETGPDEATKGIESLQSSAAQDLSASPEAPQLQVSLALVGVMPLTSACRAS